MTRTFQRQDIQVQQSLTYNGALAAGVALQTSAVSIEDDLNGLRSQMSRVLDATGAGNWYDAINTTDAKTRGIKQLNVGLDTLETKPLLQRVQNLTTISVPSGQNYVVLSASGSQDPSVAIAIALTTLGAVVAQSTSNGAAFAANELTVLTGTNAIEPKNLCFVHDATTGQPIESGGQDVYALIQVESTAADGGTFNDTSGGNRAKLSFVTVNRSAGTLVAAAASDIGGRSLQYTYAIRSTLSALPEQSFLGTGTFTDNIAQVDVTLTSAVLNQAGSPVPVNSSVLWRLASATTFKVSNSGGTQDYLAITGAGAATANVASLAITSAATATLSSAIQIATATQAINVGATAGQVDSAGLTLNSTGSNPLTLKAGTSANITDGYIAGSTWTSGSLKVAASPSEYTTAKTNYGAELSILGMLNAAAMKGNRYQAWAAVTAATIAAGTNVTGAGASPNIDNQLPAYGSDFVGQVMVFVNGQLMRPGANSSAGNDVYPGTSPATGDLMFTFALKNSGGHTDIITSIVSEYTTNS